jgi:hypothetical protein
MPVNVHATTVRLRERNPIWNKLTAPEIKAVRTQNRGTKIPVIMQAIKVYRRNCGGSKCSKRCTLPSSRKISSNHAVYIAKGITSNLIVAERNSGN